MKNLFLFFSFASFLFNISCSDDTIAPDNSLQYVKGDVIVGITAQTEIEAVFDLMNELNLTIDHMSGFDYLSPWPQDSIESLIQYFSSISYLNKNGFGPFVFYSELDNKITVLPYLYDMNLNNQTDWLIHLGKMELIDCKGNFKNLLLIVPEGTEIFWVEKLKEYEIVRWTQLNYIGGIVPH
jgi:hypothetical protein